MIPSIRRRTIKYKSATVISRFATWALVLTGVAAVVIGIWRLHAPVDRDGLMKSAAMATLVDSGQSLCDELGRVVEPAIKRTQLLAIDPDVMAAMRSGDRDRLTAACNTAIGKSTEVDAVALFDAGGKITAINTVYASGKPIPQERVDRIMRLSFGGRDIIQKCVRNGAVQSVLESQTTCDITPAFFDSTGLSVAYSVPVIDPQNGARLGVVSSRMRFERLTDLIEHRAIGGTKGSTQFVTDKGGYFSEEINSGRQKPPVPQEVLERIVLPVVQGNSDYCFTQHGTDYLCIFRLKEFTALTGGGIQVMVVADENWLIREVRQSQLFNCGVLIALGLFLFLCAICMRNIISLRQSEKWNRLLIDCALDSVIAVDDTGVVRAWNPQAERTFGYSAKQAVGVSIKTLIPPDGLPASQAQSQAGRSEALVTRKDGVQITVEFMSTALIVADHRWTCVFARDVTEQRMTESHLAQAQKLESIGQMAAGIAHEINTPTQYVGDNTRFVRDSFVQLLSITNRHFELLRPDATAVPWTQRVAEMEALRKQMDLGFLTEEIPKAMEQSIEGLNSISKIVGAMKEFSHPGGQHKEPADLNGAIESTTIVCRNRWRSVADLTLDLDPSLPRVPVLIGEFNQVVLNLVVNAADAIGESNAAAGGRKGSIKVSSISIGESVEIRVQDNGPGIPASVARKIFEPFFTTKPVGKGTGQGLMLSRNVIVKKHGGQLRFESTPGHGTVFIITLPVGEPQAGLADVSLREAA